MSFFLSYAARTAEAREECSVVDTSECSDKSTIKAVHCASESRRLSTGILAARPVAPKQIRTSLDGKPETVPPLGYGVKPTPSTPRRKCSQASSERPEEVRKAPAARIRDRSGFVAHVRALEKARRDPRVLADPNFPLQLNNPLRRSVCRKKGPFCPGSVGQRRSLQSRCVPSIHRSISTQAEVSKVK